MMVFLKKICGLRGLQNNYVHSEWLKSKPCPVAFRKYMVCLGSELNKYEKVHQI